MDDILKQRWYTVDQPWGNSAWIVAGHSDPHIGKPVCDCQFIEEHFDDGNEEYNAVAVAKHIANTHNNFNLLLEMVKLAYQKHWMNDESIGWSELGDTLANALAEVMGDDEFCKWLKDKRFEIDNPIVTRLR